MSLRVNSFELILNSLNFILNALLINQINYNEIVCSLSQLYLNSVNTRGDPYGKYGYYTVSCTVFCLKEITRTNGKMCVVHTCDMLECG